MLRRSNSLPAAQMENTDGPPMRRARFNADHTSISFGTQQFSAGPPPTAQGVSRSAIPSHTTTRAPRTTADGVPAELKRAEDEYRPKPGFVVVPPAPTERSFIFKWGIRAHHIDDPSSQGWICLATRACRDAESIQGLYGGKTSRATKHLKNVHDITSAKTAIEDTRKRSRDEEATRILASTTPRQDCQRVSLLLQTLQAVHNNLPFVVGEWEEFQLLRAVITKEEFRAVVNRQTVTHAVIELYSSAKFEMTHFLRLNRLQGVKCLAMVTDFLTCKITGMPYFGLRVYFIDAN
jgi:hypothetical protein